VQIIVLTFVLEESANILVHTVLFAGKDFGHPPSVSFIIACVLIGIMIPAVLLILEKDNQILFAKRHPKRDSLPSRWSLPSDKMEPGETIFDTAKRCAKHELCLDIKVLEIFDGFYFKDNHEEKLLTFVKATYDGNPEICAKDELTHLEFYTFKNFFTKYRDDEIGHGLQFLRKKYYS
jgi:ADP-ribose pyrophosphatase YjhB (NUDIX family)